MISTANGILNAIGPMVDAIVNGLDFVMSIFGALIALLQGDFAEAWEGLKAAFSSLWTVVQDVFTAIGNFFSGFWESLCFIAESFGIDLGTIFTGHGIGRLDAQAHKGQGAFQQDKSTHGQCSL